MNKRVVITGLGVVSSIGVGWKEFWNSLLNGKSGIGPVTSFDTSGHFTHNGGEVKDFYPDRFINVNKVNFLVVDLDLRYQPQDLRWKIQKCSSGASRDMLVGTCVGTTLGSVQNVEIINRA